MKKMLKFRPRARSRRMLDDPVFQKALVEVLKEPELLLDIDRAVIKLEVNMAKFALQEYEEILKDVEALFKEVHKNYIWCKKKYGWWKYASKVTDLCRA